MNLRLIFALLGTSALIACAGDKEATDDTAPVTDDSAEGDADADSDSDADVTYTGWTGVETFTYDFSLSPGNRECEMIWNTTGGYVDYAYNGYYTGYVTYYYTRYYTGDVQLTK